MNVNTTSTESENQIQHDKETENALPDPDEFSLRDGWEDILRTLAELHWDENMENDVAHTIQVLTTSQAECQHMGGGSGRCVYTLPPESHTSDHPHVIKFALQNNKSVDLNGRSQNYTEAGFWRRYSERVDTTKGNTVLPVSAIDDQGLWLIMPKGTPINHLPENEKPTEKEIEDACSQAYNELDGIDPTELKPLNMVVINDTLYLCDYGCENPM